MPPGNGNGNKWPSPGTVGMVLTLLGSVLFWLLSLENRLTKVESEMNRLDRIEAKLDRLIERREQ